MNVPPHFLYVRVRIRRKAAAEFSAQIDKPAVSFYHSIMCFLARRFSAGEIEREKELGVL